MILSEKSLVLKYLDNLSKVKQVLRDLDFVSNSRIGFSELTIWIFQQTILQSLKNELTSKIKNIDFYEYEALTDRATVDFVVGRVAIEIKTVGSFEDESEYYAKLRTIINNKGWDYLYIALNETYAPFKAAARNTFGENNTFFLNDVDSWMKFVNRIVELNEQDKISLDTNNNQPSAY